MFCPQCATPNTGDVKFCRSCGTELETVALALSGKPPKPAKGQKGKSDPKTAEDWLEKRIEAVGGITRGTILLTVSALIGLAMAMFMPASFDAPWMVIWTVFFGWMAVWGGIEISYGISGALEAKSRLRLLERTAKNPAEEASPQTLLSGGEPARITNPFAPMKTPAALSVTEGTTRHLDDQSPDKG